MSVQTHFSSPEKKTVPRKKTCPHCGSPNAEYDPRNNGLWGCPDCGASNYFIESEFG